MNKENLLKNSKNQIHSFIWTRFLFIQIFFFLFVTSPLCGLYNGNPSLPDMPERGLWTTADDWWGIKIGYEVDGIFSKRVKIKERHTSVKDLLDQYQSFKQFGVFTFNIIDRFEIYGLLGAMKLKISQRPIQNVRLEYETDSQLIGGVGGRVILVYWEEVILGFNARYNVAHLDFDRIIQNEIPRPSRRASMQYHEWQIGASFSREIAPFIPYIGFAYASMHSELKHFPKSASFSFNPDEEELENRDPYILFLGVGLTQGRVFNLNIETRMIGEVGLSISVDFRF